MRKQIAVLVAAMLFATPFFSPAADKLWTGAVSTDWFESGNWQPPGVPSGTDAALISANGGASLSADVFVHQLVLSDNASISGPGNLTATNLICTNAWLQAGGDVFIPTGGTFRVEGEKSTFLYRHLYNDGQVIIGASNAYIFDGGFNVYNSGIFEILGDRTISAPPYQCLFKNSGLILKSGGDRTNLFGIPLFNRGEMRILSGTLRLTETHTNEGSVNISESTTLEVISTAFDVTRFSVISPSCSLRGAGILRFSGGLATTVLTTNPIQPRLEIVNAPHDSVGFPAVRFDSAVALRECLLDGGSIAGSNTVTITNLIWSKGGFGGSGTIVIPAGGSMMVTGVFSEYFLPKHVTGKTLLNYGNIEWRDSGTVSSDFRNPSLLINRGTFRALGDGSWAWRSVNEGAFIRSGGTGTCAMWLATNWGRVEVQSGTLASDNVLQLGGEIYLNGGNLWTGSSGWRISGGVLRGSGGIHQDPITSCGYYAFASGRSEIHPGNPIGVLTVDGHAGVWGTRLVIDIAGTAPGIEHDQVVFTRETRIGEGASLSIVLVDGFRPRLGDRFEVVRFLNNARCPIEPRRFSFFSGADLGSGLVVLPEYSPTNIVLVVTNMPDSRFYVVKDLAGTYQHHIRFHGSPPTNYVLQGSTTLTNWIDVFSNDHPIDLIDYVNDYWDSWKYIGYRFYRVRWGE